MNYILESFDKEIYERDLRENIRNEVIAEVKEEVKAQVKEEVKAEVETDLKRKLIKKMYEKGISFEEIADNMDESVEAIQKLFENK